MCRPLFQCSTFFAPFGDLNFCQATKLFGFSFLSFNLCKNNFRYQPEGISFEWRPVQEQAREIVDGDYLRQQQEEDERGVTAATWVKSKRVTKI